MDVQAQYPSNIFFFNRNLQDSPNLPKEDVPEHLQSSNMTPFNNNEKTNRNQNIHTKNPRKRTRDTTSSLTTAPLDSFATHLPQQQRQILNLSQLHNNNTISLNLSFSNHHQQHQINHNLNHQQDEINQLLLLQEHQLRQAVSKQIQQQYNAMLNTAERRLKHKQSEAEKALQHNANLETKLSQLINEVQIWQTKARTQEATAASLQAQIQQAMINGNGVEDRIGEAEDAESVYVDTERVVEVERFGMVCKACGRRPASVVVLPCRHMCVCAACDDVVLACPCCFALKNSSVQVCLG